MIFEAQVELGTPDVERAAIRSCIDQASKRCRCAASTRRRRSRRCGTRASRFFAEAITHWAAPNGVPRARGTDRVDNVAFMKTHLEAAWAAIEHGEAPPTAAS